LEFFSLSCGQVKIDTSRNKKESKLLRNQKNRFKSKVSSGCIFLATCITILCSFVQNLRKNSYLKNGPRFQHSLPKQSLRFNNFSWRKNCIKIVGITNLAFFKLFRRLFVHFFSLLLIIR